MLWQSTHSANWPQLYCVYLSVVTHATKPQMMATNRETPIEISKETFTKMGYQLVDTIASFIDTIEEKKVTTGESPEQLQHILGTAALPEKGTPAEQLLSKASDLLLQ